MVLNNSELDKIYENTSTIWDRDAPLEDLVRIIDEYNIEPCDVLEIGCGTGTDSLYLSSTGFNVEAIDIIQKAIDKAEIKNSPKREKLTFKQANFFTKNFNKTYDFIYDFGFWHLYSDAEEETNRLIVPEKVSSILTSTGIWLSLVAKYGANELLNSWRRSHGSGDLVGYSSEQITTMVSPYFDILEISDTSVTVKHSVIPNFSLSMLCVVLQKKEI
jgi:SAM-dependent methyltransferase